MHSEIATALLAPGWAARRRRPWPAAVLLGAGVVAPVVLVVYVLLTGRSWVALSLDASFLAVLLAVGVAAIAARIAALVHIWLAAGRPRAFTRPELIVGGLTAALLLVGSIAVVEGARARASIAPAFTDAGGAVLYDAQVPVDDESVTARVAPPDRPRGASTVPTTTPNPSPPPEADVVDAGAIAVVPTSSTTTTTLPPLPDRPDSGVDAEALAEVTTVLLIGADSGPGRVGLRTDAMMLFSLHAPSGRASLVSVPRNLRRLLFPPGSALEGRHPYGYNDMANAVYVTVSSNQSLRSAYAVDGVRPGVVALAQAIGYSLDVTIDDYVLVDMQGFADVVDALGGVTMRLTTSIPMPGNVPGARTQYPDSIGPGVVAMDGTTALGYARSRYGDNDYYRARRQRDLLAELARQISVTDVALSFGDVAGAVGGTLRTSLSPDELADTLGVIGGETAIVESVGLVPPLVDVRRPDLDEMAKIVGAVRLALATGVPSGY
ncbi:LCP family protein [Ilumatobacter sp.]|uniref:LCP family protein n=1 Tax=Ilumatobacter sp. TaxID=1967498 RepID=UPI003AF47CC7